MYVCIYGWMGREGARDREIDRYSQIHPPLQQIPTHITLELCLCWVARDGDITSHVGAS